MQLDIIHWTEQYWHREKKFPPVGEMQYAFPEEDCKKLLHFITFRRAMELRGITIPDVNAGGFSKQQMAAALKFLDVHDKRSLVTKLKEVGVTTAQWNAWMKGEKFQEFVLGSSNEDFTETALAEAQIGLRQAMSNGEAPAIKLYYELTGRLSSDTGNLGNLKVIMAQVIEAIQRRVSDPEILKGLSDDFGAILQGRKLATAVVEAEPQRLI